MQEKNFHLIRQLEHWAANQENTRTLGLLAVIYGSLVTCQQVDLKRVVAYSSVAHMGVVVLGLFSLTSEGEIGGVYLMFAHGLVSPGLFIAVTCLYDRYNTRLIRYYRGI